MKKLSFFKSKNLKALIKISIFPISLVLVLKIVQTYFLPAQYDLLGRLVMIGGYLIAIVMWYNQWDNYKKNKETLQYIHFGKKDWKDAAKISFLILSGLSIVDLLDSFILKKLISDASTLAISKKILFLGTSMFGVILFKKWRKRKG